MTIEERLAAIESMLRDMVADGKRVATAGFRFVTDSDGAIVGHAGTPCCPTCGASPEGTARMVARALKQEREAAAERQAEAVLQERDSCATVAVLYHPGNDTTERAWAVVELLRRGIAEAIKARKP